MSSEDMDFLEDMAFLEDADFQRPELSGISRLFEKCRFAGRPGGCCKMWLSRKIYLRKTRI